MTKFSKLPLLTYIFISHILVLYTILTQHRYPTKNMIYYCWNYIYSYSYINKGFMLWIKDIEGYIYFFLIVPTN